PAKARAIRVWVAPGRVPLPDRLTPRSVAAFGELVREACPLRYRIGWIHSPMASTAMLLSRKGKPRCGFDADVVAASVVEPEVALRAGRYHRRPRCGRRTGRGRPAAGGLT